MILYRRAWPLAHPLVGVRTFVVLTLLAWGPLASAQDEPAPTAEPTPPVAAPPPPPQTAPPVETSPPLPPQAQPAPAANPAVREPPPDRPEEKDFSHGLEFLYFNAEGGYESVGLRTLKTSQLLPETVSSTNSGAYFGLGGGLRLLFLTVGPRFRTASFSDWSLWTLDIEGGLHLPLGRVEPYFIFAAGYAKLGTGDAFALAPADVSIKGFNARIGMGIDVYASKNFTIGAIATGEILAMSRSGGVPQSPQAQVANCMTVMDPMQKEQCAASAVYAADGSSLGMAGTLGGVMGLHF
jgi:hypothetical protein